MPRQLSQFWRLPFLGILTIRPLVQSSGIVSVSQMSLKRSMKTLVEVPWSAFSISEWMESMPAAFPLFVTLMARLTSTSVGGLMLMLRTSSDGGAAGSSGSQVPHKIVVPISLPVRAQFQLFPFFYLLPSTGCYPFFVLFLSEAQNIGGCLDMSS